MIRLKAKTGLKEKKQNREQAPYFRKRRERKKRMKDISLFRTHEPGLILDGTCRRSAVAIPLLEKDGETHVLFELRPGTMHENAGDICFPGGMLEEGETGREAALRELKEELCLREEQIEYAGPGDVFHNLAVLVSSHVVTLRGYEGTFSPGEVKCVFTMPLRELLMQTPETYPMEWVAAPGEDFPFERISGGKAHKFRKQKYRQVFYETPYGAVWGITGKLLDAFLNALREG